MSQPTPFFCLNAYKTARKYEQQRIELDAELARVVRTWLQYNIQYSCEFLHVSTDVLYEQEVTGAK